MGQVNVYVPDDLKAELEAASLPLSPIAQDCWRRALEFSKDMEEADMVTIDATDVKTETDVRLRFEGVPVVADWVWQTTEGKAVLVFDGGEYEVWTAAEISDDEDGFIASVLKLGEESGADIGPALDAFGVKPIIKL